MGQGQMEPMNFAQMKHNAGVWEEILGDPFVKRMARLCDYGIESYFSQIHTLLTNLNHQLANVHNPHLKQNFPDVCFAACHLNLDFAVSELHNDLLNVFFTMCVVWCCGPFNHKMGGHLILWELGIVIKFPSGCGFIFPSAAISHTNIPIGSDECRHSIAFFTAAGNLHFYHNGFMTDKEFKARASEKQRQAWDMYHKDLWRIGMDMLKPST
ncbi:hypothetical protein GYMLUDRAFT_238953 [Collybiopsis luxurians FD-317 M1]|nr:hypothetical protein GYMLUDRAFT_238953 [Collybiopsis luxurians FD-317 M1]